MEDAELQDAFTAEMLTLEYSGVGMPFTLRPSEGFQLLSMLQLALRHPDVNDLAPHVTDFARSFARGIEERLGKGRPALAEVARRGWEAKRDMQSAAAQEPALLAETTLKGEEEKRKPEQPAAQRPRAADPPPAQPKRKPDRTPANKEITPPENKRAKGRR